MYFFKVIVAKLWYDLFLKYKAKQYAIGHYNAFIEAYSRIRFFEAIKNGPNKIQITGDSIIHIGETWFKKLNLAVSAIGGDTTDSLIRRLAVNIYSWFSQTLIIHDGGNNLLRGESVDKIIGDYKYLLPQLRQNGIINIAIIEVLPLGDPRTLSDSYDENYKSKIFEANKKIPELNEKLAALDCTILKVYDKMIDKSTGYRKVEYVFTDGIHVIGKAYDEIYIPVVKEYLESVK